MTTHKEIIDKYKSYGINLNEKMIGKAIDFAIKYHGNQIRQSGEPYYTHPLAVAEIVAKMRLDNDSIITAILHDTVEDTELTISDIEKHFSPEIAKLVDGVTKLTKIKFQEHNVRQAENFRKLLLAMSDDIRVLMVKLADRLHNMRTIGFIDNIEKRKRIALETMEIYAPLAERIGAQKIKVELQDIGFKMLNPEVRESIINRFKIIAADNDKLVEKIIAEIKRQVDKKNINSEIYGRHKTAYSTWIKMQQKNIAIDQLSDIIAFRIIVDATEDCYRVLGIMHSKYKMVPGSFQDFISTPKNNDYQSLHTVVIGPFSQKIEIQIRTKEMHKVAEFGVAAHWQYKQGYSNRPDSKKYKWIRELLAIVEHNSDPEEFLQNTKMAMYYNQVFCFTTKGNLIALPKGATTVDFAYMVHSDVGNSSVSAKVNGRIVPLRTQLKNGDQVEIITAKHHTVIPSWEKFVVTGKARSEIRKIVRMQQKEQYIRLGHNIITKALKNAGIDNTDEALQKAEIIFDKNCDDLFCAIGDGTITREELIRQVKPKQGKLKNTLSLLKLARNNNLSKMENDRAVPIKGLTPGVAIHYAKCCHPLPGDDIVGVIHTGTGVTIHTSDCSMLSNFDGMPDTIIDLTWGSDKSNVPFICKLKVIIANKTASLATMTAEIACHGGNIVHFKVTNREPKHFQLILDVEISSIQQIEKIIDSLKAKEVIQHVKRFKA